MDDDQNADSAALEDQEWAKALGDFSAEKGIKPESDEQKPDEKKEDDTPSKTDMDGIETDEEKAEREKKESEEAEKGKITDTAATDRARQIRESRSTQREIADQQEAMRSDIIKSMYPDATGKLYDADGDEINTIEDVMQLRNPNTGANFTEEEAGKWLLAAQQHASKERESAIEKATEIADVLLSVQDQADGVREKYGDFLNKPENAELKKEIFADYQATLVIDENSGIITKAPVSMERFYDRALKSYIEATQKDSEAEKKVQEEAEKNKKLEDENKRLQTRHDREDLYSRGDSQQQNVSQEDKEWDTAHKEYYGNR